jgi:peroxiredoxin
LLSNIVIVVLGLTWGILFVKNYFFPPLSNSLRAPHAGEIIADIEGANFSQADRTLVMALKIGCGFCEESIPFYNRLAGLQMANTQFIAVFPDNPAEVSTFVEKHSLTIRTLAGVQLRGLGISGTPTLILVDNKKAIIKAWSGKLSPEGEEQLISFLIAANRRAQEEHQNNDVGNVKLNHALINENRLLSAHNSPASPTLYTISFCLTTKCLTCERRKPCCSEEC